MRSRKGKSNPADEDREYYVELHRQLNGESSLYLNPRSKDMMWEQTLNDADNIFSVFTVNGDYCGSMELQQSDSRTPEIGIDYFLIRISSNNLHSQHVFEKMGAIRIGEENSLFSRYVNTFEESAIKEIPDMEKFRELFKEDINERIYRYRLNPDTFL